MLDLNIIYTQGEVQVINIHTLEKNTISSQKYLICQKKKGMGYGSHAQTVNGIIIKKKKKNFKGKVS